ncbi:MAG: hypothetical protein AABY34_05520 [Pseudomonadota bacterium]
MWKTLKRHSKAERAALLKEWRSSGLNESTFCTRHQLNEQTFKGWTKEKDEEELSSFIPVTVEQRAPENSVSYFTLRMGEQWALKMPVTISEKLLIKIIQESQKCISR